VEIGECGRYLNKLLRQKLANRIWYGQSFISGWGEGGAAYPPLGVEDDIAEASDCFAGRGFRHSGNATEAARTAVAKNRVHKRQRCRCGLSRPTSQTPRAVLRLDTREGAATES
jgi:hypothetical protein